MLVDELLAQQQVVIKSLETNFKQVPGLAARHSWRRHRRSDPRCARLVRTFLERQSMQYGRAA